jgi:TonB family protein
MNTICKILIFFASFDAFAGGPSTFDVEVINRLNLGLTKARYTAACEYIHAEENGGKLENLKIQEHLKIRGQTTNSSCQVTIVKQYPGGSVQQNPREINAIPPLYPFIDGNAVLASYLDFYSPEFEALPEEVRKFVKKRNEVSDEGIGLPDGISEVEYKPFVFVGKNFAETFPSLSKRDFTIVGRSKTIKTRIDSISFEFHPMLRLNQIQLTFKQNLPDAIFAMTSVSAKDTPILEEPKIDSLNLPFSKSDPVVIYPVQGVTSMHGGVLYYIGSVNNSESAFDLIWNAKDKKIFYLAVADGFSLRNEDRKQDRNFFFRYRSTHFLIRNSPGFSELLYMESPAVTRRTLGDRTPSQISLRPVLGQTYPIEGSHLEEIRLERFECGLIGGCGNSTDRVKAVISEHLAEIHTCYDKLLQKFPGKSGSITVEFVISRDGSIRSTKIKKTSISNPGLHKCMIKAIGTWKFDATLSGMDLTVSYPFVFNAQ